jgi:uncharacterized membrane protein
LVCKDILQEQGQVLTLLLLLLLMGSLDLGYTSWAQEQAVRQGSLNDMDNQTEILLSTIVKLLQEQKEGGIVHTYLTVIVFMMGLAFVILGLYIGQERNLSILTKRLYLAAYFALIVPVTVILIRHLELTLSSGQLDEPRLFVTFLLLIPVAASYVLMAIRSRREILGR